MRSDGVTTPSAYNLYFHTAVVTPSDSTDRYRAFPLRCLSTVLGMGGEENVKIQNKLLQYNLIWHILHKSYITVMFM